MMSKPETITFFMAMLKDGSWRVRQSSIDAIVQLVQHGKSNFKCYDKLKDSLRGR